MGDAKATAQAPDDRPCPVCSNPECNDPAHSAASPETPAKRNGDPADAPAVRSAEDRARDLGFVGSEAELAQAMSGGASGDSAMMAAAAREKYTIESHMTLARKFPRNTKDAATEILATCERPEFAMAARYSFPRAGKPVEGPSAPFARELARIWGHIESGLRIISIDQDVVHIAGIARDYQTGAVFFVEDKFARKIYRKRGGWKEPDERDLRELIFRRGAICQRNAILMAMPFDLVEEAQKVVRETNEAAAKLDLNKDREGTISKLVDAFEGLPTPVSREMLETRIGKDLDEIEPADYIMIRKTYRSLYDGVVSRDEIFGASTQAKVDPDAPMEPREVPKDEMTVEEQDKAKKAADPKPSQGPGTGDTDGEPPPASTGDAPPETGETAAKEGEPADPPPARPIPRDSSGQSEVQDPLFPKQQ